VNFVRAKNSPRQAQTLLNLQAKAHSRTGTSALAALTLAALTVIPAFAILGPNISTVLAFEDQSPAAFFRNHRAMQQRSRAARTAPAAAAQPAHRMTRREAAAARRQQARNPAAAAPGTAAAPALAYAPAPANSNPLAALFGGAQQRTLPAATALPNPASEPTGRNSRNKRTAKPAADPASSDQSASGREAQSQAVCVRLCDGFFFPAGNTPAAGELASRESMCNALCPGAPTRLYLLPAGAEDISQAYSPRRGGRTYGALPVALRHTQTYDKTCSCRPQGQPHASLVPVKQDFTLRRGDAVMTDKGFRIFNGASRWPYRDSDFVPLARARQVAGGNRTTLRAIERVSQARPDFTPRQITPAQVSMPLVGPLPPRRPDQRAQLAPRQ